jgi:hypothetical protein
VADYRQIHTSIWDDAWFLKLDTDAKLLFVYLFSNKRSCLAGLYDISLPVMQWETALSEERLLELLAQFSEAGKVHYEDGYVWVPNMPIYNTNNLKSPKVQANIRKTLTAMPDVSIARRCLAHFNASIAPRYGIDTLCIPHLQNRTYTEQNKSLTNGADASPNGDNPTIPSSFREWEEWLKLVSNKPALVRRMCGVLYPDKELPSYGHIGTVAKKAGSGIDGFRRVMAVLWTLNVTNPAKGDLMPYVQRVIEGKDRTNGSHQRTPGGGEVPLSAESSWCRRSARSTHRGHRTVP